MGQYRVACMTAALVTMFATGCASSPKARETGFLSDYSRLKVVNEQRMNYASADLRQYKSYIIDPVNFRMPPDKLNQKERAEVADHFHKQLAEMLTKRGFTVVQNPGPGVARIRLALTDITASTWWKKIHPVSKMAGAGTGGAAMEGEVVDSVTGQQLGAVVQASPGNQFNLLAFSTVADVNSAIDKWVEQAGHRLDELRAAPQ